MTTTRTAPEAEKPEVRYEPLQADRWSLREHRDSSNYIVLPRGTPYEAVFEPSFFANVASKLKRGHTVYVTDDELSFTSKMLIVDGGANFSVLAEVYKRTTAEMMQGRPPVKEMMSYDVGWGGPIDRWRIIRTSDRAVIIKNIESEAEAHARKADLLRRLGQGASR
jgi:hypothetical protein